MCVRELSHRLPVAVGSQHTKIENKKHRPFLILFAGLMIRFTSRAAQPYRLSYLTEQQYIIIASTRPSAAVN